MTSVSGSGTSRDEDLWPLGALGRTRDAPAFDIRSAGRASCPAHRVSSLGSMFLIEGARAGGPGPPPGDRDCQACQQRPRETDRRPRSWRPPPAAPLHFPRDALCSFPPPGGDRHPRHGCAGPDFAQRQKSIARKQVGVDPPQIPRCQECLRGRRGSATSLARPPPRRPGHRSALVSAHRFPRRGETSSTRNSPNARANCSVRRCSWSPACRTGSGP